MLGVTICKICAFDVPNPFRKTEGENKTKQKSCLFLAFKINRALQAVCKMKPILNYPQPLFWGSKAVVTWQDTLSCGITRRSVNEI